MIDKLLIVNVDRNIEKARDIINKIYKKDFSILYLNNNIVYPNAKYKLFDTFVNPKYNSKIYRDVINFVRTWYKPIDKEFTYFNISLGNLIEMEFIRLWPLFLEVYVLCRLIKKYKPKEIRVITEYNEDKKILEEIAKLNKIDFYYHLLNKKYKKVYHEILKDYLYRNIGKLQNIIFKLSLLKNNRKKKIFIIGNLRQMFPLLKELKKDKENVLIRIGENPGRSLFNGYCDHYITFNSFSTKKVNRKLNSIRKNLNQKWNITKKNNDFKDSLIYDISLYNVLDFNSNKIINRFIDLIKYIETIKELRNHIDILVTHNDILPFERAVIRTANRLNIPNLTMIEGFLSSKKIAHGNPLIPFCAKNVAVFSENQKRTIEKYNKNKSNLFIVGHPVFDKYQNVNKINKNLVYKKYKIPLNKKIILYTAERYNTNRYERGIFGAYTEKQAESVYHELFNSIKALPKYFLIIKQHPSGSLDRNKIKKLADNLSVDNYTIIDSLNILELINISDVIITRLSTMGLEAMFLKKPIIIMDTYFNTNDGAGYTQFKAALHIKKKGELENILKRLLTDKNIKTDLKKNIEKFIKHNYSVSDGSSSLKVAELIKKLIKNNS